MDTDFELHVLAIGLEDRPGAVHSVAEVFSGRGLQMEAFHGTADGLNPDGHAQALILFRASRDRADLVTRVLRRLSSVRRADTVGTMLDFWGAEELIELQEIELNLPAEGRAAGEVVPVTLAARVTDIGTLELNAIPVGGSERWKVELDVRAETAADA